VSVCGAYLRAVSSGMGAILSVPSVSSEITRGRLCTPAHPRCANRSSASLHTHGEQAMPG
jgi:hypothetical protein